MKPTALSSMFLLAACSLAQQPPAREPFVLPAGEVKLEELVDRCAAYLGRNILVNPAEMATGGPVILTARLQHAVRTDATGCEELLAALLYRAGFALLPLDQGMLEVVSLQGPRGREVLNRASERTVEQVLARPHLKMPVTVMVPLQHVNATIATNALRPFFASAGAPVTPTLTLGNVGTNRSLLLSGMQDQVAQAIRLLQACDVPSPPGGSEWDDAARLTQLEQRVRALEAKLAGGAPK